MLRLLVSLLVSWTLWYGKHVHIVEQGALMSPNPSGKHEDPCYWLRVCVSRSSLIC